MKIKLISFYNRFDEYATKYSLGTMRLAAYIGKNEEIDVEIIPINSEEELSEEMIEKLTEENTDILGIPDFMWTEKLANEISKKVKIVNPSILRVVGGPSTKTIDFKDWNSDEIFILGEGEEALLRICEEKIKNPEFGAKDVKDIGVKNVFSEAVDCGEREALYNNAGIPRGLALFSDKVEAMKADKGKEDFAWYETNRGCAYNCGYCGHKTRNNLGYIDLDLVKEEITNMRKREIRRLFIVDPIIGGTKKRGKEILKMCNREIPNTKIVAYLRPEMLDDEFIEILDSCNLEEMRFGIQTLNPNVPAWIRSNSISKIKSELGKIYEKNINWRAELIVGLPGDDMEGLKKSIEMVIDEFQPTILATYHLTAIKGTRLYDLVDGTDKEKWLKVDENSQAKESYSYTESEFKKMAEYAITITSLYNLLKKWYPSKKIDFKKIEQFVLTNIDECNHEKIIDFDECYAMEYWKNKLKELKHEKVHNSETWAIGGESEEDYTR